MSIRQCLFAHGFEGLPTGSKSKFLQKLGWDVIAPELFAKGWSLSQHRDVVLEQLQLHPNVDYIVASSMGAFASVWATQHETIKDRNLKLVLLAPAFGVHELFTHRIQKHGIEQWKNEGVTSLFHRGLQKEIQVPYALYEETKDQSDVLSIDHECIIIHGLQDESIPFQNSVLLAERSKGVQQLILCHDDHRLHQSFHLIKQALSSFDVN
jgi:esterase/lipase